LAQLFLFYQPLFWWRVEGGAEIARRAGRDAAEGHERRHAGGGREELAAIEPSVGYSREGRALRARWRTAAFEVANDARRQTRRIDGISLPDGFTVTDLSRRDRLQQQFDESFKALDQADLPASLGKFHQQALDILRSETTRKRSNVAAEPKSVHDAYGASALGRSALTARRLVEAGVRFVTIGGSAVGIRMRATSARSATNSCPSSTSRCRH